MGDIHGRDDLLAALLRRIVEDAAARRDGRRTRLVFLGDYVDRGDGSKAVITLLAGLADLPGEPAVFLRGNHEAALLAFLEGPERHASWLAIGGRQTLASYGVAVPSAGAPAADLRTARDAFVAALGGHLQFLNRTQLLHRSGSTIFVHGGYDSRAAPESQDERVLLWPAAPPGNPGPGILLVHGHFAAPGPVETPGRICVDTGAYYSGRLTAARLDASLGFVSAGPDVG